MLSGTVSLAIKVGGALFGMVVAVLLARTLGPAEYGEYSFVIALATLVAIPAQLGLPNFVIRETVRAMVDEQPGRLWAVWRWAHKVVTLMALIGIMALLIFGLILSTDELRISTFLFALPLVPLIALGNIRGAALRGLGRVNLGQFPELVLRPAFLLGILTILMHTDVWALFSASKAMFANAAATLLAFSVGSYLLIRYSPPLPSGVTANVPDQRKWLKSSMILGLMAGLQTVNANADIVILGLLSDNDDVGFYKVAMTIATAASFVLVSLSAVAIPQVVAMLHAGDIEALQDLVRRVSRLSFSAAVLSFFVLLMFGRPLLEFFFGASFAEAYPPLLILTLGNAFLSFFGPLSLVLNMANYESDTLAGVWIGALVNIIGNIILIPFFGGVGAASATTLSILVWNVLLYRQTYARLRIDTAAWGLLIWKKSEN